MSTPRRSPVGFVHEPGNGLDAFGPETAAPSLLEVVAAYPGDKAPTAPPTIVTRPLTLRRLATLLARAGRAVALFPLVVIAWFILRIWWIARLMASTAWHAMVRALWHSSVAASRLLSSAIDAAWNALVG